MLSLVCKGLTHSISDVLCADSEEVKQFLGLSTTGNTRDCQPGHNDARFAADC